MKVRPQLTLVSDSGQEQVQDVAQLEREGGGDAFKLLYADNGQIRELARVRATLVFDAALEPQPALVHHG